MFANRQESPQEFDWKLLDISKTLAKEVEALTDTVSKLREFKDYVHRRLDEAGVPTNPDPTKTKETGCRIGPRLDWLFKSNPGWITDKPPTEEEVGPYCACSILTEESEFAWIEQGMVVRQRWHAHYTGIHSKIVAWKPRETKPIPFHCGPHTGTTTGRWTSDKPNVSNDPKEQ